MCAFVCSSQARWYAVCHSERMDALVVMHWCLVACCTLRQWQGVNGRAGSWSLANVVSGWQCQQIDVHRMHCSRPGGLRSDWPVDMQHAGRAPVGIAARRRREPLQFSSAGSTQSNADTRNIHDGAVASASVTASAYSTGYSNDMIYRECSMNKFCAWDSVTRQRMGHKCAVCQASKRMLPE